MVFAFLKPLSSYACLLICGFFLSACSSATKQTPSIQENAQRFPEQWENHLTSMSGNFNNQFDKQLLTLINEPALTTLVQSALKSNQQLQQTALRLAEQRLLTGQIQAFERPSLNLNLKSQGNKNTLPSQQQSLDLNLNWELDVWGRLADKSATAQANSRALQLDYYAAGHSLTARIIQHWVDISLGTRIINTVEQRLTSLEKTQTTITERFQRGLGNLADLEAARASTARTRANLNQRQQQQADLKRTLNLLLGRQPQAPLPQATKHLTVTTPAPRIPASVLASRPDLLAAYERILAADHNTDVAYKALLPSFNLTANLSQTGSNLSNLLTSSTAWNLLANLTAPLFNSGRLDADKKIAELQAERAYLAYQETLLKAVQEVESALSQEQSLAQQQQFLTLAKRHSDANFTHYQSRYQDGISDILTLLSAEQQAFNDQINLLQAQQARFNNRILLGLALGMGV